jgi:hypothetical protein
MYHMAASGADWLRSSLMPTRGVGKDRQPETHELTEEKQGRYHYTMGPRAGAAHKARRPSSFIY